MQDAMVILAQAPFAKFILHVAQPFVVAAFAFFQFRDPLQAAVWSTPYQSLPVRYCGKCFVFPRLLDILYGDGPQKTSLRWIQLPGVATTDGIEPSKGTLFASTGHLGSPDLTNHLP